ncbi:MAG: putative peptidoglycan lipid II flippase [Verrucomicrobiales bacterium]
MVEIPVSTEPTFPEPGGKPKRSASALVAVGILFSRLSGVVREIVFSAFMGVGATADAFGFATRIPNVLQMLLGEGTLSASFIPVYSGELERDEEEAGRVAGAVAALLALVAAIIVILSWIFAYQITWAIMLGRTEDPRFDLTVSLLRIIFPSAGLLVLSAWCLGILNSHRQFFLSYVAPVLWNIAQITAVVGAVVFFGFGDTSLTNSSVPNALADPQTNVLVLGEVAKVAAWGFLAGSALQFLVQVPNVRKLTTGLRFRLDTKRAGVREVIRRFGGAVSGRGVIQVSAFADTILAGAITTGAVAALVKAQILYILPISLFAISIAASELPELSRLTNPEDIRKRGEKGFAQIVFFVSFTALAYILLGDKIIGTLLERGEFNSDDTILVWFTLGAYAFGLVPSAVSRLTQNTLWSQGDTTGPARIAAVRVVIAIAIAIGAMQLFDRIGTSDVRDLFPTLFDGGTRNEALRFGAVGITLGSAIAAWVEAILLWRLADKAVPGVSPLRPLKPLLPALAGAAAVAVGMRFVTDDMWPPLAAALAVGLTGLMYLGLCRALGIPQVDLVLVGPLKRFRTSI